MEFFRFKRDIPFMRHALVFNLVSFLTFAAAVFFLATRGLHLSIEFTGGTVMEITHEKPAEPDRIRQALGAAGEGAVSESRVIMDPDSGISVLYKSTIEVGGAVKGECSILYGVAKGQNAAVRHETA